MLAHVQSSTLVGIDAALIEVEIDVSTGMQVFHIVGLPDGAVRESRLRVPAAITNAGAFFPMDRITVNLAPADLKKDGTAFDLAIAAGILLATNQIQSLHLDPAHWLIVGELGLDGTVRPIRGALSMAMLAKSLGLRGVILPVANAQEAAIVHGVDVLAVSTLNELVQLFKGERPPVSVQVEQPLDECQDAEVIDFFDVSGQESVKRALEVAAAGNHNLLMLGPPGSGKSMLAKRIPTILPPMTFDESLETTRIYSVTGLLQNGLLPERPFRAPHHTISDVGVIGGGSGLPRPGEISLAHNGVLFLDELPEFRKNVLEVLRQPLENGEVTISRSLVSLTYPASVMLVAAMNPCKCGYFGSDHVRRCHCPVDSVRAYRARISGPVMDRIDLHIEVPAVPYKRLAQRKHGTSSAQMRARVANARAIQARRFEGTPIHTNSQMTPALVQTHCALDKEGHAMLESVIDRFGMSARAYDRILKVARTIADLHGSESIEAAHLAEAIQYRALDRQLSTRGSKSVA